MIIPLIIFPILFLVVIPYGIASILNSSRTEKMHKIEEKYNLRKVAILVPLTFLLYMILVLSENSEWIVDLFENAIGLFLLILFV